MAINRRNLLKHFAGGVAVGAALPHLARALDAKPPESGGHIKAPLRLNHNENAYGASEKAMVAIRESATLATRYPESKDTLREAIARHHGIKTEQVVLGAGSIDVLRMIARRHLTPKKKLILGLPTCDLLAIYARALGAPVRAVPLRKDHAHDLEAMLANADDMTGLVYICNPNSPTGTLTDRKQIEAFLMKLPAAITVVVDEAYHHYAGESGAYASFIDHPAKRQGLIVTRTFSAVHGLAGLRVGYAVAPPETARELAADELPFAVNQVAIAAASAAIADTEHVRTCVARNANDRQEFFNQVNARMLRALDSHANFVLLNVMRPSDGIIEHYKKNDILLPDPIPSMPTYVRVSLGQPDEMKEFWRVWDLLGSHPMSM
jgi:histidinol-phosphate aminotransferase